MKELEEKMLILNKYDEKAKELERLAQRFHDVEVKMLGLFGDETSSVMYLDTKTHWVHVPLDTLEKLLEKIDD